MSLYLFRLLITKWPLLFYTTTWTLLLLLTVGVASFVAEFTFISAVSSSSHFFHSCDRKNGFAMLPVDQVTGEIICLPAKLIKWSRFDVLVPFVVAGLLVVASATVINNVGLFPERR